MSRPPSNVRPQNIRLDTANKLCQSVSNPANEIAEVFLDEVPGMLEAVGNDAKRSHLLPSTTEHGVSPHSPAQSTFKQGEQIWVIRGKKTKAKGNNRKRPSLVKRKNENWKKKRRNKCPVLFGDLKSSTEVVRKNKGVASSFFTRCRRVELKRARP